MNTNGQSKSVGREREERERESRERYFLCSAFLANLYIYVYRTNLCFAVKHRDRPTRQRENRMKTNRCRNESTADSFGFSNSFHTS